MDKWMGYSSMKRKKLSDHVKVAFKKASKYSSHTIVCCSLLGLSLTSHAAVDCGPIDALYQTKGESSESRVYRYNPFIKQYVLVGQLEGRDQKNSTNSAYNIETQLVYSSAGGNTIQVFDPADNFSFVGEITLVGATQTFNNALFAEGDFVGFVKRNTVIKFDVTAVNSYPANVIPVEIPVTPNVQGSNDYSLIQDKIYGVRGSNLTIIDVNTGASAVRAITFDNSLDGVTPGSGFGATWQDISGNFYTFNNNNGDIYRIQDVAQSSSTVAEKVLLANPSGSNDGFGCEIGSNPFDIDGDGVNDDADLDNDNDGIIDANEDGGTGLIPDADDDGDGTVNYADPDVAGFVDSNSDGINDAFDFDLDSVPDAYDLDSDNDGIPDNVEAQSTSGYTAPLDTDGDGVPDDTDNDGLADSYEDGTDQGITPVNTDSANSVDFLNTDSDGDGFNDTAEAGLTLTNNDLDGDGLDDAIDNGSAWADPNGTINDPSALPNRDNAEDVDYRDDDPTFAPVVTITEDTNNDGIISGSELSGNIDVTVTLPSDAQAGDVVDVSDGNGNSQSATLSGTDISNGSVTFAFPNPGDGNGLLASATVTDAAGNVSTNHTDSVTVDTSGPSAPTATIDEDANNDGFINAAELNGDIDVTITLPADAVEDDSLSVSDGNGNTQNIVLNASQITAGSVSLQFPNPGGGSSIDLSAQVTDQVGNAGQIGTDTALVDTAVPSAPTVTITEDTNNDGFINATEANGDINIQVGLPGDAEAGDTLTVSDNFGQMQDVVLSATDIANGSVNVTSPSPGDNSSLTVSGVITDQAGNTGTSSSDSADIDTSVPLAPTVVISEDANDDGFINQSELAGDINVTINLPAGSQVGDVVTVTDGTNNRTVTLTATDISNGSVEVTLPSPGEGNSLTASANITDEAGNSGPSANDSATVDTVAPTLNAPDVGPTSDSTPELSGATDQPDGATITIQNAGGQTICTATVSSGSWACTPTTPLSEGDYTFNASTTDQAGNQTTTSFMVTIDYDRDDDGIPDIIEGGVDTDNDTTPDYLDTDSDNDGIPDSQESGMPPLSGNDSDGDGIDDAIDVSNTGGTDNDMDGIDDDRDPVDTDGDGVADYRDEDSDNDGIPDADEGANDSDNDGTPDYRDDDSDGDGIPDADEGANDSDNDGTPDYLDNDSDGDGIPDADEGANDSDNDGIPDYRDEDSDNDGIPDADEGVNDSDNDGTPDYRDEDSDGDGIPDTDEGANDSDNDGTPDYLDGDSDGDGIPDTDEGANDSDNDGIPDYRDDDSDNDGISDEDEGTVDTDGDGTPDYRDEDSDGDGIPDENEGTIDIDGDGIPNNRDTDSDNDGIPDGQDDDADNDGITDDVEGTDDTDGDGVVDYLDDDSDGDGISDADEGSADSDNDGVIDSKDSDSDNDGIRDSDEGNVDTDGDGLADYLDRDSDNDGVTDAAEDGNADADGDGEVDGFQDNDGDGADDFVDDVRVDSDGDTVPDYLDLDSDNDSIPDVVESGLQDSDFNGVVDDFSDADGNGIDDNAEEQNVIIDSDGDGVADRLDLDSDNDGVTDIVEAEGSEADSDGDGRYDNLVDDNGDGFDDIVDTAIPDTDGDGVPDHLDLDSDGDGITDFEEAGGNQSNDIDGNGMIDVLTDADGDGLVDDYDPDTGGEPLAVPDTDNDGKKDFQDVDSDGDSINDSDENGDFDNNGVNDRLQSETSDDLETAVSGNGGSMSGLLLIALLAFALVRAGRAKLPLVFLVSIALLSPPTLVADTGSQGIDKEGGDVFYARQVVSPNEGEYERYDEDHHSSLEADQLEFATSWYFGLGYGPSHVDPEGEAGGWYTDDDSSEGYKLFLGYQFQPHWSFELSYLDAGEAGLTNRNPALLAMVDNPNIDYKIPALFANYYLLEPNNDFNIYGKLGVSSISNSASSSLIPYEEQTTVQAAFGLGLQWRFKEHWFFRLEADAYDRDALFASIQIGTFFGGTDFSEKSSMPMVTQERTKDTDDDGVADSYDECPNTHQPHNRVSSKGCNQAL